MEEHTADLEKATDNASNNVLDMPCLATKPMVWKSSRTGHCSPRSTPARIRTVPAEGYHEEECDTLGINSGLVNQRKPNSRQRIPSYLPTDHPRPRSDYTCQ